MIVDPLGNSSPGVGGELRHRSTSQRLINIQAGTKTAPTTLRASSVRGHSARGSASHSSLSRLAVSAGRRVGAGTGATPKLEKLGSDSDVLPPFSRHRSLSTGDSTDKSLSKNDKRPSDSGFSTQSMPHSARISAAHGDTDVNTPSLGGVLQKYSGLQAGILPPKLSHLQSSEFLSNCKPASDSKDTAYGINLDENRKPLQSLRCENCSSLQTQRETELQRYRIYQLESEMEELRKELRDRVAATAHVETELRELRCAHESALDENKLLRLEVASLQDTQTERVVNQPGDDRDSIAMSIANNWQGKCSGVQVSHATSSSVTVSWVIPSGAIGRDAFLYEIQQCDSTSPDEWTQINNQVDQLGREVAGVYAGSWVVSGLVPGGTYRFRVRVKNVGAPDSLEWSDPSAYFCVGKRTYSPCGTGVGGDEWTEEEMSMFRKLDTPAKIQSYLDTIPMNQEVDADVSLSALEAVRQNHAHCLEGAILGAYILSLHGRPAQIMDLRSTSEDDDHVVTLFQVNDLYGCMSVSNHASLRYRNPVYKSLRELALSYFDDYMNGQGVRSLRSYSSPIDLNKFGTSWWKKRGMEGSRPLVYELDRVKHFNLFNGARMKRHLRPADEFMLLTTVEQREWQYPPNADDEAKLRNANR